MSFVQFWIGFTIIGIGIAVWLLRWAITRRQFKESDRAGYLALADVSDAVPQTKLSRDAAVLIGVFGAGIAALVVSVVFSLIVAG